MQQIVGAKCKLPVTKIQEPVKVNLEGQLIDYARENQIIPRKLKASWTVHYSEGMWKLESSIKKYEKKYIAAPTVGMTLTQPKQRSSPRQ
jgi:hypothetical protein